jgi:uncharacterized delta-60 repeat protein
MIKTFIVILTLVYFFTGNTFSQVMEEWIARYSGPGSFGDEATALAIDNLGNVYVTGFGYVSGPRNDYVTIKYDSNGDTAWVRRYNGTGNDQDQATAIAVDILGNVYVTGESPGTGFGEDYATVKYNSIGEEQWVARYDGPGNNVDIARDIEVDDSGNVYVTGDSYGFGYDYATIKYNFDGDTVWIKRYNGSGGLDYSRAISIDDSGNVYVTGTSVGLSTSNDYLTIKYDSTGDEQWTARYNGGGNGYDDANAMALDDSGNVYVTGRSADTTNSVDCTTIKYNTHGEEQWVAIYHDINSNRYIGRAIVVDNNGYIYVTGEVRGSTNDIDCITIKYDMNGDTVWARKYNGTDNTEDFGRAIAVDNYGNVYVTGESRGYNSSYDYVTIKYNPDGLPDWIMRYNGPANYIDKSVSIAVDNEGNVFVTGTSAGIETDDYATIKYSQSTGIEPTYNQVTQRFTLSPNYPNPFNPVTHIEFQIPKTELVSLKIYSVLGQEIATLIDQPLAAGQHQVRWDAGNIPSGIYFYRLTNGKYDVVKKMLLIK